jgi:WD40 repeat protein
LYWIAADGSGRRVLVDGGPVEETDEYYYRRRMRLVAWSPDGSTLAYGRNGLNLYDMGTGNSTLVLENVIEKMDQYDMPREIYTPNAFSPDGTRLLVNVGWFEGGTYAVFDLPTNTLIALNDQGILCCDAVWVYDSSAVLVASPWLGMIPSGMWRVNADTGDVITLLDTNAPDNSFNYAGWPFQLPGGDLLFFFRNSPEVVDGNIHLTLVGSGPDAVSGRAPVRGESHYILEALWSADGAFVVAVTYPENLQVWPFTGTATLIHTDGSPLLELVQDVYELRWGP